MASALPWRAQLGVREGDLLSGDRTAWERIRGSWAQAESVLTRVLLLFVFVLGLVAQFVAPVGDAMEGKAYLGGAILSLVGYVLYSEVRDLRESLKPPERQEVDASVLGDYFADALPGDPCIDAVGFTGETVVSELMRCLTRRDLETRPHVGLRIIVPDFTKPMEIPGQVNADGKAEDDEVLRRALLEKVLRYVQGFEALARRMSNEERGRLDCEFRVLHISPFLKFCLIGREQLFDGIYDQVKEVPALELPARQVLDLRGYDATLTRWHIDAGAAARERIRNRGLLFDTLWGVARPLVPAAS
ncbi:ATP/GTP-binding protein [Streptomyces sp. NPDC059063]|uniref:ATP/GTP-binding protein n=1 Tax=unclassified Streptomyces TaxID=2593676 RepID=UPI0036B6D07B